MTRETYDTERKVERIELALFGNGVEGIVDRIVRMEDKIDTLSQDLHTLTSERQTILYGLKYLVGLTLSVLTLLIAYKALVN